MGTSTATERNARTVSCGGWDADSGIIAASLAHIFCVCGISASRRVENERVAHRAMERRRHADAGAEIDDAAREPLQLERLALLQIVMHRRRHIGMQRVREGKALVGEILR